MFIIQPFRHPSLLLALFTWLAATQASAQVNPVNLDRPNESGSAYTVMCEQSGDEKRNCCTTEPQALCFYVSTAGSDSNDGRSQDFAVASLHGAQQAISRYVDEEGPIQRHIEVRIEAGTYFQCRRVSWDYYTPGYYIYFVPSDYTWGADGTFKERPLFHGLRTGDPWFRLNGWRDGLNGPGDYTRLGFYYLAVQNYGLAAVIFDGPTNSQGKWNGRNIVYGMHFSQIGTKWSEGAKGQAGIFLVNSRENVVKNNHFIRLENDDSGESGIGDIHAVYLKNWSSHNVIRDNRMEYISGDPVRVRYASNDNDFRANVMKRTGQLGQYSDFYQDVQNPCERNCADSREHTRQECPSWRNWFRYNQINCGYNGKRIPHFYFFGAGSQDENRYCVPSGCVDYDPNNANDDPRVQTASNTETCR